MLAVDIDLATILVSVSSYFDALSNCSRSVVGPEMLFDPKEKMFGPIAPRPIFCVVPSPFPAIRVQPFEPTFPPLMRRNIIRTNEWGTWRESSAGLTCSIVSGIYRQLLKGTNRICKSVVWRHSFEMKFDRKIGLFRQQFIPQEFMSKLGVAENPKLITGSSRCPLGKNLVILARP